jgi:hypothetical protein
MPYCRGSELDAELESHHGSQTGSGAVSEHEGEEIDEDEAAAAADFTPMTEEKRVFVNEWIAKLGNETFDDENQVELRCGAAAPTLGSCCASCLLHLQFAVSVLNHLLQYMQMLSNISDMVFLMLINQKRITFHASYKFSAINAWLIG